MSHRNRCRSFASTLIVFAASLLPTSVLAAGGEGSETTPLISLTKLIGALLVVLVVFWVFAWLMRQLQRPMSGGAAGLRILGALSVGHREKLVVIQAGSEQLLLGVTPSRIERLHVLDAALPAIPGTSAKPAIPGTSAKPAIPGTSAKPAIPGTSAKPATQGTAGSMSALDEQGADFKARLRKAMSRRVDS